MSVMFLLLLLFTSGVAVVVVALRAGDWNGKEAALEESHRMCVRKVPLREHQRKMLHEAMLCFRRLQMLPRMMVGDDTDCL